MIASVCVSRLAEVFADVAGNENMTELIVLVTNNHGNLIIFFS